jgi:hypothetical protein
VLRPLHGNNYPIASSRDSCEIYLAPSDMMEALLFNCNVLGVVLALSQLEPNGAAGLGIFAARKFKKGEVIGYLWGKFIEKDDWESILSHKGDPTHVEGEEDYVEPVRQGIFRCMEVAVQGHKADYLLASEQCPMAYMNEHRDEEGANACINFPTEALNSSGSSPHEYIEVRATKTIQRGTEILTTYDSKAQSSIRAKVQRRYIQYVKSLASVEKSKLSGIDAMRVPLLISTKAPGRTAGGQCSQRGSRTAAASAAA